MPRSKRFVKLRRRAPIAVALIVAWALLAACGSGNDDPSGTTVPSQPTETAMVAPTALSGPPRIGAAIWTSVVDPRTNAPDTLATPVVANGTIYAVFPIESLPAGSQLLASWFFNDTSLDALDSAMRIDEDRVSGWIEFHIQRTGSDLWPDGEYEIVVTDGTNELQRAEIMIS